MNIEHSDHVPTSHTGHIAWLVLVALLGSIFGYAIGTDWQSAKNTEDNTGVSTTTTVKSTATTSITSATPTAISKKYTPVLIYTEEVSQNDDPITKRRFPTVKILQKTGDNGAVELAQVGKVGEYPQAFVLSPDHKTLYINLESKIQALDLSSKKLIDLFTPTKQVYYDFVLSPDGARMFIWDQIYASTGDYSYSVHDFNIASKTDRVIKSGESKENIYYPIAWRNDNKVVLGAPEGDFSQLWSYDLSNNTLKRTTGTNVGVTSKDGMITATYNKTIADPCNDMSGSDDSLLNLIEPISGTALGDAGDITKISGVVAFSADNKQVLYATTPVREKSKCNDTVTTSYFKKAIASGSVATEVTDLSTLLGSWGASPLTKLVTGGITVDGKSFVTSTKPVEIKVAYYQ